MKKFIIIVLLILGIMGCSTIKPAIMSIKDGNEALCLESINQAIKTIADARNVEAKQVSLDTVKALTYGQTFTLETKHKTSGDIISHVFASALNSDGKCILALVQETNKGKARSFMDRNAEPYKTSTNTASGIASFAIPNCGCE